MVTVRQCAAYLGIREDSVRRLIQQGYIQAIQVHRGGHYRIDLERVKRGYLKGTGKDPIRQAQAVWLMLCRGLRPQAENIYRQLPPEARAHVDARLEHHGQSPIDVAKRHLD